MDVLCLGWTKTISFYDKREPEELDFIHHSIPSRNAATTKPLLLPRQACKTIIPDIPPPDQDGRGGECPQLAVDLSEAAQH